MAALPLPSPVRWAGAALGLCSVLLLHWTLSTLWKNLIDTVVVRANHTLITDGPYRWVRHPFYATTLLLVLSCSLLAANMFIGVAGLFVFVLLAVRTPIEEQELVERFGESYQGYMRGLVGNRELGEDGDVPTAEVFAFLREHSAG